MKLDPMRTRLAAAWKRIPARERLILTLLYFEGLSPVEAARALGCAVRDVERTVELRMAKLVGAPGLSGRRAAREEPRRKAA